MDHEFAITVAKVTMKKLMEVGNFDEFRDWREPDELNQQAAEVIASVLLGEYDKEAEEAIAS